MRISDRSSDVCSSDLQGRAVGGDGAAARHGGGRDRAPARWRAGRRRGGSRGMTTDPTQMPELLAKAETLVEALPYLQRSEEHTAELQSLMRNSYDVFCFKKKK